jgi:hypothetical protein
MIDWIEWTKCRTCGHTDKRVFQRPTDAPFDATPSVRCPNCGHPAGLINFPAFDIETIDLSAPIDPSMYDTIDDW